MAKDAIEGRYLVIAASTGGSQPSQSSGDIFFLDNVRLPIYLTAGWDFPPVGKEIFVNAEIDDDDDFVCIEWHEAAD